MLEGISLLGYFGDVLDVERYYNQVLVQQRIRAWRHTRISRTPCSALQHERKGSETAKKKESLVVWWCIGPWPYSVEPYKFATTHVVGVAGAGLTLAARRIGLSITAMVSVPNRRRRRVVRLNVRCFEVRSVEIGKRINDHATRYLLY